MIAKSTACIFGLTLALAGCARDETPAASPQTSPKTQAIKPPPVAPEPPRPQQAASASDLTLALTNAEPCVKEGRIDRRCVPFRTLREGARGHRKDAGWQTGLRALIDQPGPRGHLALELMADGFVELGDLATLVPRIMTVVDDTKASEARREQAVRALIRADHPGVVDKAMALLAKDASPRVRAAAAYLLGKPAHAAHRARAIPALLAALKTDQGSAVRRALIQTLGLLKPKVALTPLIALIDDPMVGPNATMAVAGYEDVRAWKAVYSRIQAAAESGAVRPALLASLVRLQAHPKYDAQALEGTLQTLIKTLEPKAGLDRTANMARDLASRHLRRIQEAKAKAATPK